MLDFMIIALPRSGTTWAGHWLSTGATNCVHDPLYTKHYRDWDSVKKVRPGVLHGVSCTGIWRWANWVNQHPARKVILHRDVSEIRESCLLAGIEAQVTRADAAALHDIGGKHVHWTALFDPGSAADIWAHLVDLPFDPGRHRHLRQIEMQPNFASLDIDRRLQARLSSELNL